jgi:hypothetical protein
MMWPWAKYPACLRLLCTGFRIRGIVRRFVAVLVLLVSVSLLSAHTVITTKITWSREVSRIAYLHCASCHHDGGSSFSLMTYEEARPWAEAIKQQVIARRMPPWNAVKGFGEFKNDRGLTQEEIGIIANWVTGGAPEGVPAYMPARPDFAAKVEETQNSGLEVFVSGTLVTKDRLDVIGIEAKQVPPPGALQVIAQRPDGSIEPLIWVEQFNPRYTGTYYFQNVLRFPAGTKIQITPPNGEITLVVKK